MTIIILGAQGAGKTKIAESFKKITSNDIIDEWINLNDIPDNKILVSNIVNLYNLSRKLKFLEQDYFITYFNTNVSIVFIGG
jgi:hypothetical protein